jgi:hypothetical protein
MSTREIEFQQALQTLRSEKEMENSELKNSVRALRNVIEIEQIKKQQDLQAGKVAANEEIRQLKETIAALQEQRSSYLEKRP